SLCLITTAAAFSDKPPLDCGKKSLAEAVANANAGDTISFTGVCQGPVVVSADGITIAGVGSAIIDGGGHVDAPHDRSRPRRYPPRHGGPHRHQRHPRL